jgi:hypothetical protein
MEPNHFWLNGPPQLRERWDRGCWRQRAQTAGLDRFAKRRATRQPKKWLATDLLEAIAAAEVTLRAGAIEAAAWAREEVTGAEAWVRVGAMELAAWVMGAAAWVRAGATDPAAWVMGAAAWATEQPREVAELQIRRLVTRLLSGLTWSRLTSATPRGSWPGSRYATLRAPTWSLFLRSNVACADTTGSQISKKHGHRGGRWFEPTTSNHFGSCMLSCRLDT